MEFFYFRETQFRVIPQADEHINLDASSFASAFHPGSNVDGVAPNIVMGFPCTYHSCCNWTVIDSELQDKVVETLFVDAL